MRDPRGELVFHADRVSRKLRQELALSDFLFHPLAREFVQEKKLVDFTVLSPQLVESPRLPFVSYPDEWTDLQLFDAGALTLEICERLTPHSLELKDASAWNIIFDGCRPMMCDHLSFAPIDSARWWAFGQFVRHFVLPLGMSRWRSVPSAEVFRAHRDGLQPFQARALLGARRYLTRLWPLLMDSKPGDPVPTEASGAGYHSRLFQFLRWQLSGVAPRRVRDGGWVDYEATRSHYNEASIDQKRTLVSTWVERLKPSWVLDLGCNLGEFSLICSQHGARVISADYDANCVEALYRSQRENRRIHPIVANLDDLSGGRGWGGEEFPGLATRLAGISDMVLALGLIHHLAITHSIPLPRIADFLHRCTNRFAIVECIAETDPLVARLCAQRGRRAEEFSLGAQIASLGAAFHVRESIDLSGTQRCLLLLEKNGT